METFLTSSQQPLTYPFVTFQLSLTRPEAASELSAAVVRRGLALIELSPQHLGLEEVFLRLIHEEDVSS